MTASNPVSTGGSHGTSLAPWALAVAAGGVTALIATAITTLAANPLPTLEWLLIAAVAIIGTWLAVYDFREQRLPNRLVWPLYAATSVLVASCALDAGDLWRLSGALLSAAALWGIYLVFGLLGAVAYGDVKLAGALALALGWWGIIPALLGAAAAYILALPHAAVLVASRRGRQIPFGPYMIGGCVAVLLWQILARN